MIRSYRVRMIRSYRVRMIRSYRVRMIRSYRVRMICSYRVRMIRSYRRSRALISTSDFNREKEWERMWLLHKNFPFVPTVMQNVPLNLPLFSGEPGLLDNAYC